MFAWLLAATLAVPAPAALPDAVPPPAQVMALPPGLRARLRDEVLTGNPSQMQRLQRLLRLLSDAPGLGMHYREDASHTVAQAYAAREANCLSFTLLFLALAREAGLTAYPQGIDQTLAWHQDGGTIYYSNHVNAGVRIGGQRYTVDVAGDSVMSVHPPVPISNDRLLAHYYNNNAVERMQRGETTSAMRYMQLALDLDPGYAIHWSNAGVLHLRDGDLAAAGRAYAAALELDPESAEALFNMANLYRLRGNRRREAEFQHRLGLVQEKDPLHHFLRALEYEKNGDYANATERYRQAIRLHPGEYRFHLALAKACLRTGDVHCAALAFARADAWGANAVGRTSRAALPEPTRAASN